MPEVDVKDGASESHEAGGETPAAKPGEKTDPALLLESLKDEREKRRVAEAEKVRLEAELFALKSTPENSEAFSDEGRLLESKIDSLKEEIALKDLNTKFPVLTDHAAEFGEFRKAYPGVALDNVAKLFLSENGLAEAPKERKGLERGSGGGRTTPTVEWTPEKIEELRVSNFRKYSEYLKQGKFRNS